MRSNKYRWWKFLSLILVAIMLAGAFLPEAAIARPSQPAPAFQSGVAQDPVSFAVSPELSSIKAKAPAEILPAGLIQDPFGPYKELPNGKQIPSSRSAKVGPGSPSKPDASGPIFVDPLKRLPDPPMPNVDLMLEGLNQGANRTLFNYGVLPPDTIGAISGDYYIQTVNGTMAIWDLKQYTVFNEPGKVVYGPLGINRLWDGTGTVCEQQNDGDPIVLWDNAAKRFLVSQFALPYYPDGPFYECIAISKTADPMMGFYLYTFQTHPSKMDDYPKFGVWPDGYYMSVNQFNPNGSWAGAGAAVFERAKMLAGNPKARMIYIDTDAKCKVGSEPECVLGGMLPADVEGAMPAAGTPNYFTQFDDDAWGYSPDQLQIWEMKTNWTNGTATFKKKQSLTVNAFDSEVCTGYARDCITQPGTAQGLDAIADRLMYRLVYRKFPNHTAMVVNHTVNVDGGEPKGQAGIRWYELRSTGGAWSVYQQGTYAPDTENRWMGSMAIDEEGNIALGFSISSASTAPNMGYVGRKPTDPLGTLPQSEVIMINPAVAAGSQLSTSARWGDYSMMDVAPDGCYFWYTTEYLRGNTSAEWYTKIGTFKFDDCSDKPAKPTMLLPTGESTNRLPVFTWRASPNATYYLLSVYNRTKGAMRYQDIAVSASNCNVVTNICTYKPLKMLMPANYSFAVAAVNWADSSSGYLPLANWKKFTVK